MLATMGNSRLLNQNAKILWQLRICMKFTPIVRLSQSLFPLHQVIRWSGGKQTFLACIAPFLSNQFSGRRCLGGVSEAISNHIMVYIVMSFSWAVKYLRRNQFFFGANNMQIKFESLQVGQVVSSLLRRSFVFSQRQAKKDNLGQVYPQSVTGGKL